MPEWVWVDPAVVLAIHDEQLAEHGGAAGLRDPGLLDSALARPRNVASYEPEAGAARIAAAYAHGIARNHPFVDGNKRTGFVVLELFLRLNGHELRAEGAACVDVMVRLAAGAIGGDDLAGWVAANTVTAA